MRTVMDLNKSVDGFRFRILVEYRDDLLQSFKVLENDKLLPEDQAQEIIQTFALDLVNLLGDAKW